MGYGILAVPRCTVLAALVVPLPRGLLPLPRPPACATPAAPGAAQRSADGAQKAGSRGGAPPVARPRLKWPFSWRCARDPTKDVAAGETQRPRTAPDGAPARRQDSELVPAGKGWGVSQEKAMTSRQGRRPGPGGGNTDSGRRAGHGHGHGHGRWTWTLTWTLDTDTGHGHWVSRDAFTLPFPSLPLCSGPARQVDGFSRPRRRPTSPSPALERIPLGQLERLNYE